MNILQLSVHFSPNLGGVETHLLDLVNALTQKDFKVIALSYQPLVTKAKWLLYEKRQGYEVIRLPWLAGLFYKLVKFPALEFIYLLPGLFLVTPFVIFIRGINVIHAHGLVAGFVGVFWGKIFGKKIIISTHNIYHFPKSGIYRAFVKWIFRNADYNLSLSKKSQQEILNLGIDSKKCDTFTYWINLNLFKKVEGAKEKLFKFNKFVVLFVGRLVEEKGIIELLESLKDWRKDIILVIAGSGPLESVIRENKSENIKFVGALSQEQLPVYYSASDILIVPSVSEEGFGRVILESLACGTPIIGAKRGAIPEAMDESVGRFISVTPSSIKESIENLYSHPGILAKLRSNTRKYAERRYSQSNVEKIVNIYKR